jgi:hypothetical protein
LSARLTFMQIQAALTTQQILVLHAVVQVYQTQGFGLEI